MVTLLAIENITNIVNEGDPTADIYYFLFICIFFIKFICKRFKYIHSRTGKYKNCSCLINLHVGTLAVREAT
jgi:hypothetical protein